SREKISDEQSPVLLYGHAIRAWHFLGRANNNTNLAIHLNSKDAANRGQCFRLRTFQWPKPSWSEHFCVCPHISDVNRLAIRSGCGVVEIADGHRKIFFIREQGLVSL